MIKKKPRLSKSFRKYLRLKKAEIRRTFLNPQEAEEKIKELEELKKELLKRKSNKNKKAEKLKNEKLKIKN